MKNHGALKKHKWYEQRKFRSLHFNVCTLDNSDRGWNVCRVNMRPDIRRRAVCHAFRHNTQWGIVINQFYKRKQPVRNKQDIWIVHSYARPSLTPETRGTGRINSEWNHTYRCTCSCSPTHFSLKKTFMWYLFGAKYCTRQLENFLKKMNNIWSGPKKKELPF